MCSQRTRENRKLRGDAAATATVVATEIANGDHPETQAATATGAPATMESP